MVRALCITSKWLIIGMGVLVGGLLGCGGGNNSHADGGSQRDSGSADVPPVTRLVWRQVLVDSPNAGHQVELALAPDGSLGMAYYRPTGQSQMCNRTDPPAPTNLYDIVYANVKDDGTVTKEVVTTVPLLNLQGLGFAYDANGNPAVAFMGGAEAAYRCGGTDIMLARRTGPSNWTITTVGGDGNVNPVFSEDSAQCAAYQDTCHVGDVVGTWAALAFSGNEPVVAYQDIHFGFAQDDFEKADLELLVGGERVDIDSVRGAGVYPKILIEDDGNPSVMHYCPFVNAGGIWQTWKDANGWHRQKVVPRMSIGYKLGYARFGEKHGLAYYPPFQNRQDVEQKLWYVESPSGMVWGSPEVVDAVGDTGKSPSLAFDPAGRPAIAYYRCRDTYDPRTQDCNPSTDGIKLAVKGSVWESVLVWNDTGVYDGTYVALVFDKDGLPAIAYQAQALDTSTSPPTVVNELVLLRSKVQ